MNSPRFQFGIAAAALAVAVVGGGVLLSMRDPASGITATASPGVLPTASTVPFLPSGSLEPGTYRMTVGPGLFALTVPAGWTSTASSFVVAKGDVFEERDSVALITWNVTHVYRDSCDWEGTLVETATPEALAAALAAQKGHQNSAPMSTTLGGYPATRLEFSVPAGFDLAQCDQPIIRLWPDAGPSESGGLPIAPGQMDTVYVVDVAGTAHLFAAIRWPDSPPADVRELEGIVDSIRFEP
jgi:hypothetical protein